MARALPRELLTVRRRGEDVAPVLAPSDDEHVELAASLARLFEAHVGRPRAELDARLQEEELRWGTRFKLVRGLATLLERRCRFEVASRFDPVAARRVVFEEAAKLDARAATTPEARERAMREAARRLGATPDEVELALVADQESAMVLAAFDAPEPAALLRRYNLGLVQTLLFDAVRVEVEIERGFRPFLGLVKLHGLMHTVTRAPDGTHRIALDGPLSLFQDTRRYGTAVAKTLPGLAACGRWTLDAEVRPREDDKPRWFRASSDTLPIGRGDAEEGARYDSDVERRFAEAWASLRSPWRLEREPAAIQVEGGELFIPDFGFAWRDGPVRAYLEIVGFWTPRYLERKLQKVRALPPDVSLLLAVDAALGMGEGDVDGPEVVLYKGDVPVVPVVQWLKTLESRMVDDEVARVLAATPPPADAPVVTLAGLAAAMGVTRAAVERALPSLDLGARVRVGDALVAPRVLERLDAQLAPGMPLADVDALARAEGIDDSSSLLAHLGYVAAWRGLDPSSAVLRRRDVPARGAARKENGS